MRHRLALLFLPCVLGAVGSTALAQRGDPGSLLLFPLFDQRPGVLTLVTVTNTDVSTSVDPLWVEWRFRYDDNGSGCKGLLFLNPMTPGDTETRLLGTGGSGAQGYLTIAASTPAVFNALIGTSTFIDAFTMDQFSIEPFSFQAIGDGTNTDVDGDGVRDLDGIEYSRVGDEYLMPRFYGQNTTFDSELILVDLSGGCEFTTNVDFLTYNDNEESFSMSHSFSDWERVRLQDIAAGFSQDWLALFTNHDPAEIVGATGQEAGWFQVDGITSSDGQTVIADPALVCAMITHSGNSVTSTPFFPDGRQGNGSLPPQGGLPFTTGDGPEGSLLHSGPFGIGAAAPAGGAR